MSSLGIAQKPKVAARYPHMMIEDITIWTKFLELGFYVPNYVWYDVRVGKAVRLDEESPVWMHIMSQHLTRKRIDVVGAVGPDYWVIELKPRASYQSFGQVVFYAYEFEKEYAETSQVRPVIITDRADPDILPLCNEAGVLVIEVSRLDGE